MKTWLLFIAVVSTVTLAGCDSNDWQPDPVAQRLSAQASLENAEANRIRAEGEAQAQVEAARIEAEAAAYATKKEAYTEAEAKLAAVRQRERDAAHQRAMEMMAVFGLVTWPLGLGLIIWLALCFRSGRSGLALVMPHLRQRRVQGERAFWHAVATLQRRQARELPAVYVVGEEPEDARV